MRGNWVSRSVAGHPHLQVGPALLLVISSSSSVHLYFFFPSENRNQILISSFCYIVYSCPMSLAWFVCFFLSFFFQSPENYMIEFRAYRGSTPFPGSAPLPLAFTTVRHPPFSPTDQSASTRGALHTFYIYVLYYFIKYILCSIIIDCILYVSMCTCL